MTGASGIGVVIVDDHPLIRAGLRAVVDDDPGLRLLGEGGSGAEAVELVRTHRPDVLLVDIRMPLPDGSAGLNGIEVTRRVCADSPSIAVLVLTMVDDDAAVLAALRAGARGYLLKEAAPAEIVAAIHAVAQGVTVLGASVTTRVVTGSAPRPRADVLLRAGLTAREREVLTEITTGATNAVIAHRLGLSEKTVRNNVSVVLAKLAVPDRQRAAALARSAGVGLPGTEPV